MLDRTSELVYVIGLVAGSVIRVLYTRAPKRCEIADDRKTGRDIFLVALAAVGMVVIPALYLLTSWLNFADYHWRPWAGLMTGGLGAAVFAPALWLLWRSHVDLGRNWSPHLQIRQHHTLVTGGVYRRIRHPMYAAHWLWAVAQALLLHNWIAGGAFLAAFFPLYLLRVPREEQMMLAHFGQQYRVYAARTGRLIPPFWK